VEFKWQQNPARDVQGYEIVVTDQAGGQQKLMVGSGAAKAGMPGQSRCTQGVCTALSSDLKQGLKFKQTAANGQPMVYSWTVTTVGAGNRRSEPSAPRTFIPTAAIAHAPANSETVMDPVEFKWQQSPARDVVGYEIAIKDQLGKEQRFMTDSQQKGTGGRAVCGAGVCSALSSDGKLKIAFKHQLPDGRPNLHSWTVSTIAAGGKRSAPSLPKTFIPAGAIALAPDNAAVLYPVEFKWQQNRAPDLLGYEIVVTGQDGSQQKLSLAATTKGTGTSQVRCLQGVCSALSGDLKQGLKFSRVSEGKPVTYSWTVSSIGRNGKSEPSAPKTFLVQ